MQSVGRFHTTKQLEVSDNIILWFQPPHSSNCNFIGRFWAWIKTQLAWKLFNDLDELKQEVTDILNRVLTSFLASLTGKTLFLSTQFDSLGCNIINLV